MLRYIERLLTKVNTHYLNNGRNNIGKNSSIYYKSKIINNITNGVCIGVSTTIGRTKYGYHVGMPFYTTLVNDGNNSHITIGNSCRINGAYIHAKDYVEIGDYVVMASGINIIDSNAHQVNSRNRTTGQDKAVGIRIGNNVWIGLNVTILKNSVIGDNCVVAAGSVVKGIFPENSIIQGNPAVVVGKVTLKDLL